MNVETIERIMLLKRQRCSGWVIGFSTFAFPDATLGHRLVKFREWLLSQGPKSPDERDRFWSCVRMGFENHGETNGVRRREGSWVFRWGEGNEDGGKIKLSIGAYQVWENGLSMPASLA